MLGRVVLGQLDKQAKSRRGAKGAQGRHMRAFYSTTSTFLGSVSRSEGQV